jgi:ankyrin repeat protein
LESLTFPQLDARMTNVQRAHFQTCRWFLTHPKCQDWLDPRKQSQTHGFLWIVGKAGAGKSTIMKFAYLETKKRSKDPGKPVASFFFNARGDVLERSVAGMYRSLLLQLMKTYPDLQVILDDADIVPSNQAACPDINILKEAFRSATMSLDRRSFTCFVDALDECDEQEVRDMVQFFEELAEETTADDIQFRVCFSSRPYPYIDIRPEVLLVLEKEDGHAEDLSRYVQSRLKIKNPLLLPDLKLRILDKAAGIFMWIVLVVDILNKEGQDGSLALGKRLEEIPSKLSDLFKSILTRDQHQVERLLLCVLWVLCAKRPLTPAEFRHALWAGLLNHDLVDDALPENTAADAAVFVTSSSKGLAEITKSKLPTVQFIHESVRDFLVKENGLRDLWPDLGLEWEAQAHEKLRHSCSTYLSLPAVQPILERHEEVDQQDEEGVPTERYPFLEYASQQVLHHSDAAAVAIPQDEFISQFFSSGGVCWLNLFEKAKIRQYSPYTTPLYVLADRGFANLVRTHMKRGPITCTRERYKYPFFAALAGGHDQVVAAFLGLPSIIKDGIDLTDGLKNRQDLPKSSFRRETPLSWAIKQGRLGLVKALVEAGEDINHYDRRSLKRPPLQLAISRQRLDIAWCLLTSANKCESEHWRQSLARLLGVATGTRKGVRALVSVETVADLRARDDDGNTPLHLACKANSISMVRSLINKGAGIHDENNCKETALHFASLGGNMAVASLLIEKGADVNASNTDGETALHLAAWVGNETMALHLINMGADVDASCTQGRTALMIAVKGGLYEVVWWLIKRGASVNAQDGNGRTALGWASLGGGRDLEQISGGSGNDSHTDKKYISFKWRVPVMAKTLILYGCAEVDIQDDRGFTPLMEASRRGLEEWVELLVEEGADASARNDSGATALDLALEAGEHDVVQILKHVTSSEV